MSELKGNVSGTKILKGSISAANPLKGNISSTNTVHGRLGVGSVLMTEVDPEIIKQLIDAYWQENLPLATIGTVELLAEKWVGNGHLYSQVVSVDGVTEYSQVDLTPDVEQLVVFYEKDLTFVTENDGGVVTVYAIGQKPTNDYSIQVTITEVSV